MHQMIESPPLQVTCPPVANERGDIPLSEASASDLMCAMRDRLDRMSFERRQLTARLAAIVLVNIANRKARS